MKDMIKRYVPFAVIIFAVYMLVPMFFVLNGTGKQEHPITYDLIFPLTAVVCSVIYGKKYGIDFFFSLVAPVIYIPSMVIFNGISANNIIFVAIYLVSSIFGLFFGDMFFAKKETEPEPDLDVDLDIEEAKPEEIAESFEETATSYEDTQTDDFFDKYGEDNIKSINAEDEIDKILNEIRNK